MAMSLRDHALFQVAVKTILRKDDEILVLTTPDGYVDFPGGRMDTSEIDMPLAEVLKREVREELGPQVMFEINHLAFVAKRQYDKLGETHRIMAIYFDTTYVEGEFVLSDEHVVFEWKKPEELLPLADRFVSKDEFEQFKTYFDKH